MTKKNSFIYMPVGEVVTYQVRNRKLLFLHVSLRWLILKYMPWLASKIFRVDVDERLVEYPFIYMNLPLDKKARILDIGCVASKLPLELASLGYQVYALDVRDYPLKHPNLTFIRGDIRHAPFPPDYFDVIIANSTIEHIGLGRWGNSKSSNGDKEAIEEIIRMLKPDGRVIITVPFGRKGIVYSRSGVGQHRVYDYHSLTELLAGLYILTMEYAMMKQGNWVLASSDEVKDMCVGGIADGIALVVAQKVTRAKV